MSNTQDSDGGEGSSEVRKAGVFDMRNFIAGLIGFYGVVLLLYGIIGSSDAQAAKSQGLNINLWAGIGMIVVTAGFLVWAKLRPVIVSIPPESQEQEAEAR